MGMSTWNIGEAAGIGFGVHYQELSNLLPALKRGVITGATPTAVPTPSFQTIFGPENGSISHQLNRVGEHKAGVRLADGVIHAVFRNPYPVRDGRWSHGFLFRNTSRNVFHAVVINSDGHWYHYLRRRGTGDQDQLVGEGKTCISTFARSYNIVSISMAGRYGTLSINYRDVANLDLSGLTSAGDVSAIANYFSTDGLPGASTRFENFTIWSTD